MVGYIELGIHDFGTSEHSQANNWGAFTEAEVCRNGDSGPNGVVLVQVLRGAIFTYGVTVVHGEGVCW